MPLLILFALIPCQMFGQRHSSPNCDTVASPPPLATFGGPATVAPGTTELGLAAGAFGELFPTPCGHGGATNWLVRWRRGVRDRIDLGFDVEADNSGGGQGATTKIALRYLLTKGLRLEAGLGASDTGFAGRSVNADVAAVLGTTNPDKTWNYYTSLRFAASRGCANLLCAPGTDSGHPPGALIPLGVIGTSARVADNIHFILEAGLGAIFSREHPDSGGYLHLSFGVSFNTHKSRK